MSSPALQLLLDREPAIYRPGENVSGRAIWSHAGEPRSVVVRLYWTTSGRGTTDTEVAAEVAAPSATDAGEFRFSLAVPPAPPSFSGKLISLEWGVELLVEPGERAIQVAIVVSPTGGEIRLPVVEPPPGSKKKWWRTTG